MTSFWSRIRRRIGPRVNAPLPSYQQKLRLRKGGLEKLSLLGVELFTLLPGHSHDLGLFWIRSSVRRHQDVEFLTALHLFGWTRRSMGICKVGFAKWDLLFDMELFYPVMTCESGVPICIDKNPCTLRFGQE